MQCLLNCRSKNAALLSKKQTDHQSKYWLLHFNFLDIPFITLMTGMDSMEKYIHCLVQRLIFLVTIHEIIFMTIWILAIVNTSKYLASYVV